MNETLGESEAASRNNTATTTTATHEYEWTMFPTLSWTLNLKSSASGREQSAMHKIREPLSRWILKLHSSWYGAARTAGG